MIFRSVYDVIREVWQNRARMMRIVLFDIKIENRNFYLGTFWKILSPLIQLGTFWLVFGIGIRGGAPVDGHPFLVWMLAGLVPWFFINRGITLGAMSISGKAGMLFKIKYPISSVPVGTIALCLYDSAIMMGIMVVIYLFHGILPSIYWLNLIYYYFFAFIFLSSLALTTSVIVQLAKDFGRLISSLLQLLFFLTPILWVEGNIPSWARPLFVANPVRYVVTGFRYSMLYKSNFFERPLLMAFFWSMIVCILFLGCFLQRKYATRLVDWM